MSKGLTWQVFRYYCGDVGLPLGKFVIPNPFGPLEDPRFTAYLMKTWKDGKPAGVKTPDYVRDNIHADLLAVVYSQFAERVAASSEPVCKLNPSGYVESQGAFALRVAREVKTRTPWACDVQLAKQTEFSEPLTRTNQHAANLLVPTWSESAAWDQFVNFYYCPLKPIRTSAAGAICGCCAPSAPSSRFVRSKNWPATPLRFTPDHPWPDWPGIPRS